MKIVIAPDSFKESLSADKCCQAIKAGFSTVFPDARYVCLPIADGGEGTVDAMVAATGGKRVSVDVSGPMGEKVNGFYGLTGDGKTAIIEMAAASGLMLVAPEARNPLLASSFGTGELIRHALDAGIRHIILGIGGSATVDGGMGVAQALGVRFLDAQGTPLGAGGGNLSRLASIDLQGCDPRISECRIEVACDVDNPLVGPRGAAAILTHCAMCSPMAKNRSQPLPVFRLASFFYASRRGAVRCGFRAILRRRVLTRRTCSVVRRRDCLGR